MAEEVLRENYVAKPPVPVFDLATNYGFEVIETELPGNIAGLVDLKEFVIFINQADTENRKAFTVAHELGHIKLHSKELKKNPELSILYRKPLGAKDMDPKEQEANFFAASLLVPQKIYKEILHRYKDVLSENGSGLLAKIFGVSQEVMGYRFNHFKLNTKNGAE